MDIPRLGIGTYKIKKDAAYSITLNALKLGYRHIDTANLYKTEESVGKAIRDSGIPRDEIFVTTKISINHLKNKKILTGVQRSFEMLGLDYIDLILLHRPVHHIENWKLLVEIYKEYGDKIRHIGVSNFSTCHLSDIMQESDIIPYINQVEITPFLIRDYLVTFCKKYNIKIVAHSSITKGEKLEDENLMRISKEIGISPTKVLLRWGYQKGYYIIPRTEQEDHLKENISILNAPIDPKYINELDSLNCGFATHPQYIYDEDGL